MSLVALKGDGIVRGSGWGRFLGLHVLQPCDEMLGCSSEAALVPACWQGTKKISKIGATFSCSHLQCHRKQQISWSKEVGKSGLLPSVLLRSLRA